MKRTIGYGLLGLVCGGLGRVLNLWSHSQSMDVTAIFMSAIETGVAAVFVGNLVWRITAPKRINSAQEKGQKEGIKITVEDAKNQLMIVAGNFNTLGEGRAIDRLAQLVLQPLQVLQRRLDNKDIIKMLYLDNSEAKKVIPSYILDTLQDLCENRISRNEAKYQVSVAIQLYQRAFVKMEISPQVSKMLFVK